MKRSPKNVYAKFIGFEEQAAEIYLQMASRFCPENQKLSSLWLDMGMQEKQHAGLLQFCVAEGLFAPELPSDAEIDKLERHFLKLKAQAARPELSLREAFEIAIDLETSEVNGIYSYLTTPLHSSMYLLRRKVMVSLPDHVERLMIEGKRFGIPAEQLKKLTKTKAA